MAGLQPDRVLTTTVLSGALIALAFLYGHVSRELNRARAEITEDARFRAELLDSRLEATMVQLRAIRSQAMHQLISRSWTGAAPDNILLDAFLASNPGEESARLFTLDRVPPPFAVAPPGNMVSMTTLATRRRTGLSRPDPLAWQNDAALGLDLLPMMNAVRSNVPEMQRIFYATASGVVAFSPWSPSGVETLLDTYPTSTYFRAAAEAGDDFVWEVAPPRAGGIPGRENRGAQAVSALPLVVEGSFHGVIAAQLALSDMMGALPPPGRGTLILADADGLVLAASDEGLTGRRIPLPGGTGDVRDDGSAIAVDRAWLAVNPLRTAPLVFVRLVDRSAVMLPTTLGALGSLGVLVAVLGLVLLVSHRLMRRALTDREQAATAERTARSEAEKALADLRAAHDELDFLNREKTRFFSLISHDLRGPFNSLLGMTEELAAHGRKMRPEDVADFAASTHESARQVFELLENLLQWSRVQMSGKPFAPSVFPLRDLVSDAIKDARTAADAKEIHILDAVGDRWVLADRTMILAILRNLLINSVKFSHPGGVIHITSRAAGDQLEVAVTDHGIGMDQEQVRTLLRAEGAKTSRPGTQGEVGTGLGLTLVRDLVLRHGGELKVDSTPGVGTVVSFTVPLTAAPTDMRQHRAALTAE